MNWSAYNVWFYLCLNLHLSITHYPNRFEWVIYNSEWALLCFWVVYMHLNSHAPTSINRLGHTQGILPDTKSSLSGFHLSSLISLSEFPPTLQRKGHIYAIYVSITSDNINPKRSCESPICGLCESYQMSLGCPLSQWSRWTGALW